MDNLKLQLNGFYERIRGLKSIERQVLHEAVSKFGKDTANGKTVKLEEYDYFIAIQPNERPHYVKVLSVCCQYHEITINVEYESGLTDNLLVCDMMLGEAGQLAQFIYDENN